MGLIHLEDMEFYSYHGHYKEEQVIGNKFIVDIVIHTSLRKAADSDKLSDTLNYQEVYNIVKNEMSIKSYLLENIASRIINAVFSGFQGIESITVKVSKLNPSLGGRVKKVSITMTKQK